MPKYLKWLAHILALIAGLAVFFVIWLLNEVVADMLVRHLPSLGLWAVRVAHYPLVVDYLRVGQVFDFGYPITVGLTTVFFFWNGLPRQNPRIVLYLLLLCVIGPLTFINYIDSDQWLNLWLQSGLNLFVAFVGYVLVLKIREFKAVSPDTMALQSLSILLIASLLVALPLFYTAIFLSVALHLTDQRGVQALSEKIPLTVAGLAGVIAVLLSNLDKLRLGTERQP